MIEITKRLDEFHPIGVVIRDKGQHESFTLTLAEAKGLHRFLSEAIEWAVNMDDLRHEKAREGHNV